MLRDVKTVILLVGLVLKCVLGENQTENSIIIMTPHVWICDQYATQTMLIDTVSDKLKAENVNVVVTLKSRSDSSNVAFNVRETVRANSNGFHRFDFELPDRIEHGFYDVEVNVIGDDSYSFNGSLANLECRNSQNGIYIITDKPVYKDSEKVRIRVVNIDSNLLPVSDETASIYIMDPNKNRVQQFLDVEFTNGLIDGLEFKLTDRPIYGDWEIKVAFNDTEKSINFNVKEYVLPKFDFKLNLPEYIIRNSKEIKGSVEAKYTYGKPLDGDVKVRLENLFYGPYVVNNQTSYQSGTVVQYEQVYTLNKGKIDFTLPFKASDYSYNYKVNVTVTDKYSDESSSKESMLNILWNEFYARLDNYDFNPNQTNYLKVDLVQPNEKPYAFKKINVTIMQKSVDYSISYNYRSLSNDSFFLTSDVNGRLNFSFFVEPNVTNIEITLVSGDDSSQIAYVYLYKRIENQIQPPTPVEKLIIRPETNDTLELDTQLALKLIRNDTGENCVNARYFVLGKLQILMDSVIELCEETTIYIELGAQYAPYSTVVVYYVDSITKNVTVASYEININNFFRNHLEIAFSSNTTQPGEDVEIELYTRENSLVSLCIIDKSVELLRQPNELTINDINTQMLSTRLYGYYPPYPSPSSNVNQFGRMIFPRPGYWQLTESLRKLHNQGLIVASDLDDLFANFTEFQGPIVPLADGPINAPPALAQDEAEATSTANFGGSGGAAAAARPQGAAAVVPRSNFQETWIWDTYDVKNSTQKFIYSKIPDTITSWVASGFSINSEYGLAIANKTSITTFKNFFVSMILPPSLVRGEILHLQIVVYNYFDHDLKNVLVVLSKTDDFKEANGSRLFNITNDLEVTIPLIESQNAQTVEFLISPVSIGQLPLTVKAVSDEAGDGETRKLKVKAEGIEQASTQALLIELDNTTALTHDFHIDFPANIVKDSEFCSIQVIGDLLGPSLNNLNRLVSKPYGCGEQNMVTLTPNIYALNYLYAIADPNSPSKNKISNVDKLINDAKSNILFGFQNQLKYVLDDGSFSAFGKSDVNGSTWLTSFVVKSFAQARKYAPEIDNRVIQKAVKFLIEQQKPNGAFAENGRVIHSDMQGGVSSEQTITAYVAIALIESQLIDEITTESIKSALTYLEREAPKIKDQDAYALGIVTYALTLGNSDDAKKYYELFQSKSIRSSDGNINWSKNPNNPESSSDVELTSYGLLLTLLRNDLSTSLSIVKYLVGKSSSLGSYSNTQDTVLALQALSQFGIRSSESGGSGTKSVDITTSLIDSSSNTLASKTFKTTEENSIVLQTWDLPSCRAKVSLKAQGSGTALFQLIASYNIPKNPVKPVFTIRQNTTKSATNSVNIKTCATYNKDSTSAKSESTGMTLIEATLLSGYEANKQELDGLVGNVKYLKLVEIKDQQVVVFYLDQLDDSNELCVEWKMHKVNDVDNLQAVPVKVYDYYQSNLEYSILFTPPSN